MDEMDEQKILGDVAKVGIKMTMAIRKGEGITLTAEELRTFHHVNSLEIEKLKPVKSDDFPEFIDGDEPENNDPHFQLPERQDLVCYYQVEEMLRAKDLTEFETKFRELRETLNCFSVKSFPAEIQGEIVLLYSHAIEKDVTDQEN